MQLADSQIPSSIWLGHCMKQDVAGLDGSSLDRSSRNAVMGGGTSLMPLGGGGIVGWELPLV